MSKYTELKAKHQAEVDAFPLGFAFNKDQYDAMMSKWGLLPTDRSQIIYMDRGCFVRKSDYEAMHEMFERHETELKAAMQDYDFAFEAFNYELANHEYCITHNYHDALEALGIIFSDLIANPTMYQALEDAIAAQED
jgi:hypothetical protein